MRYLELKEEIELLGSNSSQSCVTQKAADPSTSELKESPLTEALRITRGDRQESYGPPRQDFIRTAAIWSAILGYPIPPTMVPLFMIGLKVSREVNKHKRDNLVDIAGYVNTLDMLYEDS